MPEAVPSSDLRRVVRVGREAGAVHAAVATCELAADGSVGAHLHSFEELVYVLAGTPRLDLDEGSFELGPGQAAWIGPGEAHAWSNPGGDEVGWIELHAPPPRAAGAPVDTIAVSGFAAVGAAEPLDPTDPRRRRFGRWRAGGADGPIEALPGITATPVIDTRQGAAQAKTFVVEFSPGTALPAHDHPFEETFYVLEGEIAFSADGVERLLTPGDVGSAPVGGIHAFENRSGAPCLWLESQSPLPPARGNTRVQGPWSRLAERG